MRSIGLNRTRLIGVTTPLVLTMALAGGVAAADGVIQVPDDFVASLSDTRSGGQYAVDGSGLRIWTQSNTSADKVAEYIATDVPLADVGEPGLELTNTAGSIAPGFQLIIDFNDDGTPDGLLVGEPGAYGNDWWLTNASAQFVKDGAPVTGGGSGSPWHGTLAQWRTAFPDAQVVAFGFSLGSGVLGDWTIDAINFAGTRYTFAEAVTLTSKDECKKGGWQTSTNPVFKNQGECVSSFATAN